MKTEAQIKQLVREYLNSLGDKCVWFMPAASCYGRRGVSDFIVCCKGRFVAIECKKECGTIEQAGRLVSPLQKQFLKAVALSNGIIFIVYNALSLNGVKSYFNCPIDF